MNREQRRKAQHGHIDMADLRHVVMPPDMTDAQCRWAAEQRLQDNIDETWHPFHHRTGSGAIVAPDPTLDYLLSRIPDEARTALIAEWTARIIPSAPQAIPVNRTFYGVDPYENIREKGGVQC